MAKITFSIDDKYIWRHTEQFGFGDFTYKNEPVMDKETFVKAYEKWIKGNEDDKGTN